MLNVSAFRSTDGGKTMTTLGGSHSDHHDLWIDPDDPTHLVLGNDGGGAVSFKSGQPKVRPAASRWTAQDIPTPQYYHVVTTSHIPYHVCGAQQDGSTVCVPSEPTSAAGAAAEVAAAVAVADVARRRHSTGPAGPSRAMSRPIRGSRHLLRRRQQWSFLTRLDRRTGQLREVNPYPRMFSGEPSSALLERWQWTFPIIFSPADPTVLYTSSQHLWKTTNGGQSGTISAPTSRAMIPDDGAIRRADHR